MFSHRLRIGNFFGIDLFVHWSFALLVAFVTFAGYMHAGDWRETLFILAELFTFFLCITLHEYGHSLTARRFGIETVDITLLPIGGAARLRQIPRIPIQELLVAIAGPAVNVVIALLIQLMLVVAIGPSQLLTYVKAFLGDEQLVANATNSTLAEPSWLAFAWFLLTVNTALVLFNLIPAFPMDGGRVLRSLMAMVLPYLQATRWAQRIGVVCACGMAWAALTSDPPQVIVIAIAAYVCYAGMQETRHVALTERLHGLRVCDVMVNRCDSVPHDMPSNLLEAWWQHHSGIHVAVTGLENRLLGVLPLKELVNRRSDFDRGKVAIDRRWPCSADEMINQDIVPLMADQPLESAWSVLQTHTQLPVVNNQYQLVGCLDIESLLSRADLARLQGKPNAQATSSDSHPPTDYLFAL